MPRLPRFSPNIYQIGLAAGLVSLSAFFTALILAFSFRVGTQPEWQRFQIPSYLWMSTVLLAASSAVLEAGKYSLRRGAVRAYRQRIALCLALGIIFLALQTTAGWNLIQQGVAAKANPHGSAFYVFMGIHAAHLIIGIGWLIALEMRSRKLQSDSENALRKHRTILSVAAIYWHFMGIVWAVMFFCLLFWSGS